jgi:hypothetical protein
VGVSRWRRPSIPQRGFVVEDRAYLQVGVEAQLPEGPALAARVRRALGVPVLGVPAADDRREVDDPLVGERAREADERVEPVGLEVGAPVGRVSSRWANPELKRM